MCYHTERLCWISRMKLCAFAKFAYLGFFSNRYSLSIFGECTMWNCASWCKMRNETVHFLPNMLKETVHVQIIRITPQRRISQQILIYFWNRFRIWIRGPSGFFWWKTHEVKISCKSAFKMSVLHNGILKIPPPPPLCRSSYPICKSNLRAIIFLCKSSQCGNKSGYSRVVKIVKQETREPETSGYSVLLGK